MYVDLVEGKLTMSERTIPYNHRLAPLFIRDTLYSLIPEGTQHIYAVGIGSNRINGDSLGPFVGTLLYDLYPNHLTVLGNLHDPLDATTFIPALSQITLKKIVSWLRLIVYSVQMDS